MNKITRTVVLCLVAIITLSLLAGCFSSPEKKLIGTWIEANDASAKERTLVLTTNGKGTYYNGNEKLQIKWSVENDQFSLTSLKYDETIVFTYKFSSQDKKLTLTDTSGHTMTFTKQ